MTGLRLGLLCAMPQRIMRAAASPLANENGRCDMNDAEYALRKDIIETCLAMDRRGINQGTSGNVSVRWGEGLLITPSGLDYETMAPEDIIFLSMDGTP